MTTTPLAALTVTRLSSGYFHIRGTGPCNYAQVPHWPCDEQTLRANSHPEASEEFIRAAVRVTETPDAE